MSPVLAALIGAVVTATVITVVLVLRRALRVRTDPVHSYDEVAAQHMFLAVDSLPSGGMLVGPRDEVLKSNQTAAAMGIVRGARVGSTALLELVRHQRREQTSYVGPFEREYEPGSPTMELTLRVVPFPDGTVLVVAQDDSESRRVDAVRRDFVANISHELKTPIGAIGILSETVEAASDDPEEVVRFARRLQRESARLTELVAQIIELSRLQSADPRDTREVVDIYEVVGEALSRSREAAEQREVSLIRAYSPDVPLHVLGDRWQLADAVANLVQNAIVYSDHRARVVVSVRPAVQDGDDMVEIKVTDNGIGIKQEDQERIFERFYRVDYGRSRENGGTGLGLSIVRHIVMAHGGKISVWSRPLQGSTFTITLPAHPDDETMDDQDETAQEDGR